MSWKAVSMGYSLACIGVYRLLWRSLSVILVTTLRVVKPACGSGSELDAWMRIRRKQ